MGLSIVHSLYCRGVTFDALKPWLQAKYFYLQLFNQCEKNVECMYEKTDRMLKEDGQTDTMKHKAAFANINDSPNFPLYRFSIQLL